MKKDILNRKDIEKLVNRFYEKIKKDEVLSHYFTDVVKNNWKQHLSTMYSFWDNALFYSGNYNGNPMQKHLEIHSTMPFKISEFTHWFLLFSDTVDELFVGENAELIKQRAQSISTIMQIKIFK